MTKKKTSQSGSTVKVRGTSRRKKTSAAIEYTTLKFSDAERQYALSRFEKAKSRAQVDRIASLRACSILADAEKDAKVRKTDEFRSAWLHHDRLLADAMKSNRREDLLRFKLNSQNTQFQISTGNYRRLKSLMLRAEYESDETEKRRLILEAVAFQKKILQDTVTH